MAGAPKQQINDLSDKDIEAAENLCITDKVEGASIQHVEIETSIAGATQEVEDLHKTLGIDKFLKAGHKEEEEEEDTIQTFESNCSFQGFDPRYTAQALEKLAANKGRVFFSDLMLMIYLFLVRGTKLTKIINSVNSNGAKVIKELINTYELVENVRNKMDRKVITLARVSATFSTPTMLVASKYLGNVRILSGFENCKLAQISTFASFVTNQEEWEVAFVCAFKTSMIINAKFARASMNYRVNSTLKYTKAAIVTSVLSETERKTVKIAFNILTPEGELSNSFKELAIECKEYAKSINLKIPDMNEIPGSSPLTGEAAAI